MWENNVMDKPIKLLRYNTGSDKKAFILFKNNFDAVIFNATIVAHSGSAIADLVSVHKNQYIIDPQTHIFQHDISAISSKSNSGSIKKSVSTYLGNFPDAIRDIVLKEKQPLSFYNLSDKIEALTEAVYVFQTSYVNSFINDKEYNKYLEFLNIGPTPKMVIAPYFMLKKEYSEQEITKWLELNNKCLTSFIAFNKGRHTIAAQLVIDKSILLKDYFIDAIVKYYNVSGYNHIFLWVSDFSSFNSNAEERNSFYKLLCAFNTLQKKPIMAYGGYDSIFLCNKGISNRLYGVAQSVGYGEAREITPVGGGFPTNKYYFKPIHQRLKFSDAADILTQHGYFNRERTQLEYAEMYYKNICNCKKCRELIGNNIDNFNNYSESVAFEIKSKQGIIKRYRPTTQANLISAIHFLYSKVDEWDQIHNSSLYKLVKNLLFGVKKYAPERYNDIREWCKIYAR